MNRKINSVNELLKPYQEAIEKKIKAHLNVKMGPKTILQEACAYSLLNGGKRFRPSIVFIVAKSLDNNADVSEAALGVEFLHTASLIADDLPCMDNDDQRRNKPSLHKAFNEPIALLASYALISEGYACLAKNAQIIKNSNISYSKDADLIGQIALENVSHNTGILGATGGQYLDLNPPDLTLETLCEIIFKKTVTLFEISFVLGWIFGGGDLNQLHLVKKAAEHFGIAFQIVDDLEDMEQDIANQRPINLANAYGEQKAKTLLASEIKAFHECLHQLKCDLPELKRLLT